MDADEAPNPVSPNPRVRARTAFDARVLAAVRAAGPDGATLRELHQHTGVRAATIGAALRRLQKAGAVTHNLTWASHGSTWRATSATGEARTDLVSATRFGRGKRTAEGLVVLPPEAGSPLVPVRVADLAHPGERIRCSYLRSTLAASACAARQRGRVPPCHACQSAPEGPDAPTLGAEVLRRLAALAALAATTSENAS